MILSRGRKYIFIHIPKTGGTSMALALEERAMADDVMLGDTPKAKKRRRKVHGLETHGRLWKHSTLGDIDGLVSDQDVQDLFTFTLVRNPWDRMVSYYHWLQTQNFENLFVRLSKSMEFSDFLQVSPVMASMKAAPARTYMTTRQGVEKCDLYVRLEHFKTDIAPLEAHLGFSLDLPQENTSERHKSYQSYYSAQLRDVVAEMCQEDIERFDYSFEG